MVFDIKKKSSQVYKHIKSKGTHRIDLGTIRQVMYSLEQLGYSVEVNPDKIEWALQFKDDRWWLDCYKDGFPTKQEGIDLKRNRESLNIQKTDPLKYRLIRREIREYVEVTE